MAEAAHSLFSASAAVRWLACPGSIVLSEGKADRPSRYAAEGTVAHGLLEDYLVGDTPPASRVGDVVEQDGFAIEITTDMVSALEKAIGHIEQMTAGADMVQAETRVNYAEWLGVPRADGFGTADLIAVFIEQRELLVGDLKFGQGVAVDAKDNVQMMLYAGGALLEMDALGIEIDTVRMAIFQPRISDAPSEWSISRADLETWLAGRARSGAASVLNASAPHQLPVAEWEQTYLHPGEKQCKFCKAKATCPALRAEVVQTTQPDNIVDDMFEAYEPTKLDAEAPEKILALCLSKVDLIEDWCSAVRAEAHRRLSEGQPVPGYKLVKGKQGNRAWADKAQAEEALKAFRLKVEEMYDLSLISPTTAEKLHKAGSIGPRQWAKVQPLITRSEGKPSVAPASDPRPAIEVGPIDEAFEVQATEPSADDIC